MKRATRGGFTLWELLLALALSVIVLLIAGMAFSLQLRLSLTGRERLDRQRVASAVLSRLGEDLRRALPSASPSTESSTSNSPSGSSGNSESSAANETLASESSTTLRGVGLLGDAVQLQLDISRLATPRDALDGPTGDAHTVLWYVRSGPAAMPDAPAETLSDSGGMVRKSRGRSEWRLSETTGGSDDQSHVIPLAPEVVAVEFQYFDGSTWESEWDSEQNGGLPRAVRCSIALSREEARIPAAAAISVAGDTIEWYSRVVWLPAAGAVPTENRTSASSPEDTDSSSGNTGPTASPATGSGPPSNGAPAGGPR